jgi:tRNA modification GTPase
MNGDTVVALGTPPGESGIAVVRVSGPAAVSLVDAMAPGAGAWPSHTSHLRPIRDGRGEILDEALIQVMRAPDSYTGENVVEISCHGSMQIVSEVIEELVRRGARVAGPGEFTRRAFVNGKLDLAQAEAIADLIASETKLQRRVALEHLEGGLSRKVRSMEGILLEQLALVEAAIDFTEEDIDIIEPGNMRRVAGELQGRIEELLDSEVAGRKLRGGIRVTIMGPRNAGKSSIYNALLGEERAIVSPVPGTTRDILRERIHINGFTYHLEDTAGIAETGCDIEARGISIGRRAAREADLVMFIIDGSIPWRDGVAGELEAADRTKTLFVLNKIDAGLAIPRREAVQILGTPSVAAVSAKTGEGLEALRRWIYDRTIQQGTVEVGRERIAVNARQGVALREARGALARLAAAVDDGAPPEILSVEIRAAADACGTVTGRSVTADLLDAIFSRFCIGK